MRWTGALYFLLAAAPFCWGQVHSTEQEVHMWTDFETALVGPQPVAQQSIVTSDPRVSVAALRHKTPGKALAAFSRGVKLAGAGDLRRAAHEFARAVTIDPNYADAHANLGVTYIGLTLPDLAANELRRAIELDPDSTYHHQNLAVALILLRFPTEAEQEARAAVDRDHTNPKARYLLGTMQSLHPETHGEAAENLEYVARQMPEAHLVLADMYRREGAEARAQAEREQYREAILDSVNGR